MSVQQRVAALERLADGTAAGDIPPLVYFKGGTSDYTPDKDEAFKRYREQYKDDERYGVLRSINSFTELEQYIEQHGLKGKLVKVALIDKPVEQTR